MVRLSEPIVFRKKRKAKQQTRFFQSFLKRLTALHVDTRFTTKVPLNGVMSTVPLNGVMSTVPLNGIMLTVPLNGVMLTVPLNGVMLTVPLNGVMLTVPLNGVMSTVPLNGVMSTVPVKIFNIFYFRGFAPISRGASEDGECDIWFVRKYSDKIS